MSEIARIPVASPAMLAAIAAENQAYGRLIEIALHELESALARGEFQVQKEVRHVLWFYGRPGGMEPGRFLQTLISTIDAADMENRRRLSLGFPMYVVLVEIMKMVPGAPERLKALVA